MSDPALVTQSDGTQQWRGERFGQLLSSITSQQPLVRGTHGWVDDYSAVQLGLYLIVRDLTFRTVDRIALVEQGRVEHNEMQFQQVSLDMPDPEVERMPTPSCTIMQSASTDMENPYALVSQDLIEDTINVYGQDTVLQKLYEAEYRLTLVCWLANKDDRAAVRKRLVEVFGVEPDSDLPGRRIALPWYFDRTCRYTLMRVDYPDSRDLAVENTWPMAVELSCQMPAVQLVECPPTMRLPPQAVDVSGG